MMKIVLTQRGCQGAGRCDSRDGVLVGGPKNRWGIPPINDDDDGGDTSGDDDDDLHIIEQVQLEPLVPVKVETSTSHNRPCLVHMVNLKWYV